jgi:hypothetical protein
MHSDRRALERAQRLRAGVLWASILLVLAGVVALTTWALARPPNPRR